MSNGNVSRCPKYARHGRARAELNRRVNAYFEDNQLSKTGGLRLLAKSLIISAWCVASYLALVFWADAWWVIGLCAVSFGLAHAGIGFSVMHDGGHGAASSKRWATRLAAYSLDLLGGSSHLWAFKHNVIHHQYPNIDGVDHDIVAEPFLRMTETQRRHRYHRAQWIYFPLAYAFLAAKWILHDDFRTLFTRRLGSVPTPPIKRAKVAEILALKLIALAWIFALPIAVHGIVWTLAVFAVWSAISGLALATVFQLAHTVQSTELSSLPADGARLKRTWAEQQLAATMNFAPRSTITSWYIGGLNFQIEHHLFPRISHVHYPAIAPIVREVCDEFDLPYHSVDSVGAALRQHILHLHALGLPTPQTEPKRVRTQGGLRKRILR